MTVWKKFHSKFQNFLNLKNGQFCVILNHLKPIQMRNQTQVTAQTIQMIRVLFLKLLWRPLMTLKMALKTAEGILGLNWLSSNVQGQFRIWSDCVAFHISHNRFDKNQLCVSQVKWWLGIEADKKMCFIWRFFIFYRSSGVQNLRFQKI